MIFDIAFLCYYYKSVKKTIQNDKTKKNMGLQWPRRVPNLEYTTPRGILFFPLTFSSLFFRVASFLLSVVNTKMFPTFSDSIKSWPTGFIASPHYATIPALNGVTASMITRLVPVQARKDVLSMAPND